MVVRSSRDRLDRWLEDAQCLIDQSATSQLDQSARRRSGSPRLITSGRSADASAFLDNRMVRAVMRSRRQRQVAARGQFAAHGSPRSTENLVALRAATSDVALRAATSDEVDRRSSVWAKVTRPLSQTVRPIGETVRRIPLPRILTIGSLPSAIGSLPTAIGSLPTAIGALPTVGSIPSLVRELGGASEHLGRLGREAMGHAAVAR